MKLLERLVWIASTAAVMRVQAVPTHNDSEFSYSPSILTELAVLDQADAYLKKEKTASEAHLRSQGVLKPEITLTPWTPEDDEPPLGIPSFIWGCCFNFLGVVLVYIMTDENNKETKRAFWGCVVGSTTCIVGSLLYWLLMLGIVVI